MKMLRGALTRLRRTDAIASNIHWLFFEKGLRILMGLVVGAWVARYLGPAEFGALSYVVALVAFFQAFAQLGLDSIVVRDISQRPDSAAAFLGAALRLRLAAGVLGWFLALGAMVLLRPADQTARVLTAIIACGLVFQAADTVDLWFQSQLQSRRTVLAKTLGFVAASLLRIVCIYLGAGLTEFALLLLLESASAALAMMVMYRRHPSPHRWTWDANLGRKLLTESAPLLLASMAVLIYMRIDQIMLREMVGEIDVGIYSAALPLSTVWYVVPMVVCSSYAPGLAKLRAHSETEYLRALGRLFRGMWIFSLVASLATAACAPWLIGVLYGPAYADAAPVLAVHVLALVPVSLGVAQSLWIVHEKRPALALYRTLAGCAVNLLLNLALIPWLGPLGAAISTVCCQSVAAVLSNVVLSRAMLRLQFRSLFRPRSIE